MEVKIYFKNVEFVEITRIIDYLNGDMEKEEDKIRVKCRIKEIGKNNGEPFFWFFDYQKQEDGRYKPFYEENYYDKVISLDGSIEKIEEKVLEMIRLRLLFDEKRK